MKLRLKEIRDAAMSKPGLFGQLLAAGEVSADQVTLQIGREAFDAIMARHYGRGAMGNVLHELIQPVARLIDKAAQTQLADCGRCAERQIKLNNL